MYLQISKFDTHTFGVRIAVLLCAATAIALETPPAHSNKLLQPAQATIIQMTISSRTRLANYHYLDLSDLYLTKYARVRFEYFIKNSAAQATIIQMT